MIENRLTKERILMMNGENHENSNTRWYTILGRAFVEEALNRGHEVTLFNRGTNKELFPEVEQLIGDRNGGVSLRKSKMGCCRGYVWVFSITLEMLEKCLQIILNTIYSSQAFPYIKIGFHII